MDAFSSTSTADPPFSPAPSFDPCQRADLFFRLQEARHEKGMIGNYPESCVCALSLMSFAVAHAIAPAQMTRGRDYLTSNPQPPCHVATYSTRTSTSGRSLIVTVSVHRSSLGGFWKRRTQAQIPGQAPCQDDGGRRASILCATYAWLAIMFSSTASRGAEQNWHPMSY
jgi:hypothetical protein